MKKTMSKKIFTIFSFEFRIDVSIIIPVIFVSWTLSTGFFPNIYKDLPTYIYWIMGIISVLGTFVSLSIHELCHCIVAKLYSIHTKNITLFIFGGLANIEEEPQKASAEFLISIAGPFSSFLIACVTYEIYSILKQANLCIPIIGILNYIWLINIIIVIFNLLPIFPLDGGRIFRSFLWTIKRDFSWASKISSYIGSGSSLIFISFGIFKLILSYLRTGWWITIIGILLFIINRSYRQQLLEIEKTANLLKEINKIC